MELRHLRYFVVVAEEQNVTRAAARLNVSQPPLSRQIRDLEDELGIELFRRTAKSLALTESGRTFLGEARAILLRVDQAVQTVRAVANGSRGRLRVGYAPSLTVELLPEALRSFEVTHPGVRISLYDLTTEECLQRLADRGLDMALTVRTPGLTRRGFKFEKLATYPLCCAVASSHPLARRRSLPLAQLKSERFIVYSHEDYPEYLDWLRDLLRPHGFEPQVAGEYDGATGLITAVEAGRGVAIVASSLGCLAGPRLKLLPVTPPLPPIIVGVASGKPAPRLAEEFIVALKQAALNPGHGRGR